MFNWSPQQMLLSALFLLFAITARADRGDHHLSQLMEHPHTHGQGELMVKVEGKQLWIDLVTPAFNLFGFESNPDAMQDKLKLLQAKALLEDPSALFEIPVNADCWLRNMEFRGELMGKPLSVPSRALEAGHSDIHLHYRYECSNPGFARQINILLFNAYAGFEQINAYWITEQRDGSQQLTPVSRRLLLK